MQRAMPLVSFPVPSCSEASFGKPEPDFSKSGTPQEHAKRPMPYLRKYSGKIIL